MTDCNYNAIKNVPQPVRKKGSPRPLTKIEFLLFAVHKHGNKFDYSLVPQDGIKKIDKVKIICRGCGDIFEQIVKLHIRNGCGCPACSGRKPRTTAMFIEQSIAVHGSKYDYSLVDYQKKSKVAIICRSCNKTFMQAPTQHVLGKQGCPLCGIKARVVKRTCTKDEFIKKAINIHSEKYSYSKVVYVKSRVKVIVTCPKHGDFNINPSDLLSGKGCADCALESRIGFSRARFIAACARYDDIATLYVVKMKGNDEVFYKVGITSKSVKERLGYRDIGYDYSIITEIQDYSGFVYDLEKSIHRLLSEYHYKPAIYFAGGVKECFHSLPKSVTNLLTGIKSSNQLSLLA